MSRTPNLERKKKKRKDGTYSESFVWWTRFQLAGKRYERSTGETDKRRAAKAARRIRAAIETAAPTGARSGRVTWEDLRDWDLRGRRHKEVSAKQIAAVEYAWRNIVSEVDGGPMALSHGMVAHYVGRRRCQVKGQTIRKELHALKRGVILARLEGFQVPRLEQWPTVKASEPNLAQAGKLHEPDVLRSWLAELHKTEGRRRSPLAGIQAELVLRTGLRHAEVRRLRLCWVQFAHADGDDMIGHIAVPEKDAKNRRARDIPVDAATAKLLLRAAELHPDGEAIVPGDHAKARRAACRAIGYAQIITLRDLRHCMATYASTAGDLVAVQTILGHRDLRTTSRYVHGNVKRSGIATRALAEVVFGASGDPSVVTPPPRASEQAETA